MGESKSQRLFVLLPGLEVDVESGANNKACLPRRGRALHLRMEHDVPLITPTRQQSKRLTRLATSFVTRSLG